MVLKDSTDLLDKLPKKTPIWAIGVVSIIVSVTVSLAVIYTFSRSEIQTYLAETYKSKAFAQTTESSTLASVLELVRSNSQQITSLSSSLLITQEQNYKLSERVSAIEKELDTTKVRLSDCEASLKKCAK